MCIDTDFLAEPRNIPVIMNARVEKKKYIGCCYLNTNDSGLT